MEAWFINPGVGTEEGSGERLLKHDTTTGGDTLPTAVLGISGAFGKSQVPTLITKTEASICGTPGKKENQI